MIYRLKHIANAFEARDVAYSSGELPRVNDELVLGADSSTDLRYRVFRVSFRIARSDDKTSMQTSPLVEVTWS